jgi:2-keto-4-pentenoate hydratase
MNKEDVDRAASLLVAARLEGRPLEFLPAASRPRSVAEAHAIQDAVALKLGDAIGGFKAAPPALADQLRHQLDGGTTDADAPQPRPEAVRGLIFAKTIRASPGALSSQGVPECGVEGEIAFRFRHDLPPRQTPYSREEVAEATDAYAAIEVVSSRYESRQTFLDTLADCISNGGFVYGGKRTDWRGLRFADLKVKLIVNGETIVDQAGGHPTGDPFAVVMALVEMTRATVGVKAGQFVTCGSHTGLRYFKPGDVCRVEFEDLGEAQVTFAL